MPYPLMCVRTARAVLLALALVFAQTSGDSALAQSPTRLLDQVALEVTSVEDSSHYLLYRYRLRNSVSSVSGVAGISLDLSAQRGTGVLKLPSTGRFVHGAEAGVGPISDHVPVGVINPEGWTSGLARRNAILSWGPREGEDAEWERCGIRRRQCTSGRFQTGVWPPESISSGCPAIFGRTDTGILLLRLARRVSSPGSLSCERLHCCPHGPTTRHDHQGAPRRSPGNVRRAPLDHGRSGVRSFQIDSRAGQRTPSGPGGE